MNNVSLKGAATASIENGSILKSKEGELYILTEIEDQYVAICLNDGRPWTDLENTQSSAIHGLTLVATKANIDITPV